jgi:hypothetical protein
MKRTLMCLAAIAAMCFAGQAMAQCSTCGGSGGTVYGGYGITGSAGDMTAPTCPTNGRAYPRLGQRLNYARQDHFSPHPVYAYSRNGIDASRTDVWNRQQMDTYAWHGNHAYWQYGQPTALVVPPTAAFQSEYNWGVGQTRSLPIYHQYGRDGAGMIGGGQAGGFAPAPYWPSSTSQFGVYPVRGPWHH